MNEKPRIALIPDRAWWIIGEMGKQIAARFGGKYDFCFLPAGILARRPDLLKDVVASADVIHCLSDYDGIELLSDHDRRKLPPIVTWFHHVTQWNANQQLALEMSSALVACTPGWKQLLEQRVEGRIPITVVPHGVDADFFHRRKVRPSRFGIPPGRFVVGFLGNKGSDLDYGRKGTDVLLEVARKAAAAIPNFHLVMGGPGWDKEVQSLRAMGVSVSATGYLRKADLPALYSALDVYLLTSRVEGGPVTILEAMACETAVVSTRVGAVPRWIADGVNGYSADVGDVDGLLAAIVALHGNPDRRADLVRQGRATAVAHSWGQMLAPLEAVYDDLIRARRAAGPPAPRPRWMNNPDALLRASCAADALLNVYSRVRRRSLTLAKGLKLLREMLYGLSPADIAKGAAMIRRYEKTAPSPRPTQPA
ncbi:MAG: glycosyltransferase family 4 protein [Terracidiphilus sp.]